jgi:serine carboxypeptidase-like clade II
MILRTVLYLNNWIFSSLGPLWTFGETERTSVCCNQLVLNCFLKNCSGDQDSVIPLTGSRTLVQNLAHSMGLKTTTPYRVWFEGQQVTALTIVVIKWRTLWHFFTEFIINLFPQVGGWTQVYGDGLLSFATIRGASHEAPFSQPERSLVLFRAFLQGQPLPETLSW